MLITAENVRVAQRCRAQRGYQYIGDRETASAIPSTPHAVQRYDSHTAITLFYIGITPISQRNAYPE